MKPPGQVKLGLLKKERKGLSLLQVADKNWVCLVFLHSGDRNRLKACSTTPVCGAQLLRAFRPCGIFPALAHPLRFPKRGRAR